MKVFLLIILALVLLILSKPKGISVKSEIDGNYYIVKPSGDPQRSADTLAEINKRIRILIVTLEGKPGYNNLRRYSSIKQNIFDYDTAYTLNKKDTVFCLTPIGSNDIHDINTLMYVAIHELAHIASNSIGHTPEFDTNFKNLLKESVNIGIYSYVDYNETPVDYCGIDIKRNVLTTSS